MEKSSFNKITKEVFLEYGFVKYGSKFLLLLDDISIVVRFSSCRNIKYFNYNFGINALYDASVPYDKRFDSVLEIVMEHTPELRGYDAHEIQFEKYSEEEYRELLYNMIHRYFDSYKNNALQFIKDNECRMCLSKKAKEYLGLI